MPISRHFKGQLRMLSRTQGLSYFCKGISDSLETNKFVKTRVTIDIGQLFFSYAHKINNAREAVHRNSSAIVYAESHNDRTK